MAFDYMKQKQMKPSLGEPTGTPINESGFDDSNKIIDLMSSSGASGTPKKEASFGEEGYDYTMDPETRSAAMSGLKSGGVSGALMSGGISSMLGKGGMAGGGPYALAGGLVLSQIQARMEEDKAIQDKYDADMANQQNNLMALAQKRSRDVYKV